MTDQQTTNLPDDIWLIRPCEVYKEEYKDCKSLLSRVYQHYVYGTQQDCSQWMTDFNNCMKFRLTRDTEAAVSLVAIETERRQKRLQLAKDNDVWEYRKRPPPEWLAPLETK
ncbi:UPF0545 protein [Biomphalaria glabrata]|uniref:Synaptic plasticity regulator PANTS n=1 Tax=Biomphalaria glabrata TaxID=6526 RepID=A0A9U8EDJ0_BIOGL|nr:UPF0545 protein C22orf39 homolog [Biomphalaria glabrata]KAI8738436.1 putative UPF0545 protein C22orf39 [Biomphalaria glabrata]KAI8782636.1 UPF0545 protein C22orf39 [Biomphalaria glabrata]